ncbi:MAG: hypothetical protein H6506_00010 [Calditrichaeota bacterium]|nr:hypothetical protein [Calditrichota bacterium]MCB9391022.1 hypothetical protein [Calditrichota bacterium]
MVSTKGVSLSPRSFSSGDFVQFFELAETAGRFITWTGNWTDFANPQSAAEVVASLSGTYDYEPVIVTSWFSTETGAPLQEMNDSTKQRFLEYTTDFVRRHRPPYLVVGVELNTAYDFSAANFQDFASYFPQIVDCVHTTSPTTKVAPDFLWEKTLGYHGGLFGGTNDTTNTQFELIAAFPDADFIGFNSYPSLIFAHPDSIPTNYYSRISSITNKPVAFFETGWHTANDIPGWESSEAEQVRFVERYLEMTSALDPLVLIWPFLFDPQTSAPFNSMGLWDRTSGNEKPAWSLWRDAEI